MHYGQPVSELQRLTECWNCLFKIYKAVGLTLAIVLLPIHFLVIPFVILDAKRQLRILAMILFLATWLEMLMDLLQSQPYQAISDVVRIWQSGRTLKYFEDRFACCGVLGFKDYIVFQKPIPESCYVGHKPVPENLHKIGCSTVKMTRMRSYTLEIIFSVFQFSLVLSIVTYWTLLRRIDRRRTTIYFRNRA
ncbi:uncharacterized protein Dana_GF20126, isoform A [Drosophila ananassae]|uniref:Uncharacterized protein, isoform A n=1 Tax=Drosophila ananassae TaxID=7217 RepID=B3M5Z3_DROAN|nr:protein late bloomer isoform X2 [Drosophila ananassae]EDV40709.2 uncharacterized protein Dana_GF20126, isoform A [Drosophila ananassae]